jgi:hypothetical protein
MYAIVKKVVMPAMASVLRLGFFVSNAVITTEDTEESNSKKRSSDY